MNPAQSGRASVSNSLAWEVAAASDMCVDLVLSGNVVPRFRQVEQLIGDYWLEIGGSANIFACQMAKLGATTGVIGAVGEDAFGRFLLQGLEKAGVQTKSVRCDPTLRTGLGVALAQPDDRAILTYLGSISAVQPEDLPVSPEQFCRHWHLASYFLLEQLQPAWPAFIKSCRAGGVTISLDPNWDPDNQWEGIQELLPLVDVFLPNEAEAAALTGHTDPVRAGEILSQQGPLVVIKCGEKGVVALRGNDCWELRPEEANLPVPAVVDAVGAGDNFDAGFLRAWLQGLSIPECLLLGHRCAVASLCAPGGIQGQLHLPAFD